ncbi:ArdC family protein [Phocaeicola sartorii]|uniref:ArdC family protein n=1 Tax=Phocaeicola sartorii TaxID=671267 RepID=UPI00258A7CB1|nr:zincin-like metallopeptidase domain-containing protein [Phocaeicola sartorii]
MAGKRYNSDGPSAEERALERFTELMIKKISSIKGDWKKPWFTENFMAWPKNLSGREYNGMNALMLMLLCEENSYKLPVFCTFQRVSGLNYSTDRQGNHKPLTDANGERLPQVSVLKGEKSFPVFITTFTVVDKETKEKIKMEDYRKLSPEEQKKYSVYPKLNVHNVFNVAQTNLREARPELYEKLCERNNLKRPASLDDEKMAFAPLDEMIEKKLWVCPISLEHQDSAYYSIAKDAIVLPEKSQFINGESFYGTLLHEMTHSTGAEGRLDRIKPAAFGSKEYAREELVAELGSALVASQYGITKTIKEDSAQYLGSWLDVLKESPEFLKTTLFDVKKASSMIAQRIDAVAEKIEAKERMFYSSVAYLQFSDDTGQFDELKEKGDYEGLLALGREYYDGNGINEKYTYLSPLQNKGDDLLIEDKDFAVVYNGSVGGTYEVMLKFTEQEIRDHIKQYGVDIAGETIKEVARDMVAEQFDRLPRSPVLEMASGDILYLEYNREKDCLAVGTVTNAGLAVQHSFAYNHNQDLDDNLQDVQTALEAYPEYQYRGDAAEERVNPQIDLMDADNDGNTQEVAHEEREQEDVHVPYRRGR